MSQDNQRHWQLKELVRNFTGHESILRDALEIIHKDNGTCSVHPSEVLVDMNSLGDTTIDALINLFTLANSSK